MPTPARHGAALLAAVSFLAGGCSLSGGKTDSATGRVGVTLDGPDGLRVKPVRFQPRVRPRPEVSGLATPRPGTHFAAFLIRMCVGDASLPTLSAQSFRLDLAGGGTADLKFPQTVFGEDLDLLGIKGCERGYIVFQVPRGKRPSALRFKVDKSVPDPDGGSSDTHVRLRWKL